MMITPKIGRRRPMGIIRERLDWIDAQRLAGWDRVAIIAMLEAETGALLSLETFKKYLYRARKERKILQGQHDQKEWVAQSASSAPRLPVTTDQPAPEQTPQAAKRSWQS
ncbi:hypothetical protein HW509_14275 [Asaia spathodeae]|uniref:hypothetical protein n=1 Tax=Asaia spathodeae TaxID=657016 RepID=UPI002FC2F426